MDFSLQLLKESCDNAALSKAWQAASLPAVAKALETELGFVPVVEKRDEKICVVAPADEDVIMGAVLEKYFQIEKSQSSVQGIASGVGAKKDSVVFSKSEHAEAAYRLTLKRSLDSSVGKAGRTAARNRLQQKLGAEVSAMLGKVVPESASCIYLEVFCSHPQFHKELNISLTSEGTLERVDETRFKKRKEQDATHRASMESQASQVLGAQGVAKELMEIRKAFGSSLAHGSETKKAKRGDQMLSCLTLGQHISAAACSKSLEKTQSYLGEEEE